MLPDGWIKYWKRSWDSFHTIYLFCTFPPLHFHEKNWRGEEFLLIVAYFSQLFLKRIVQGLREQKYHLMIPWKDKWSRMLREKCWYHPNFPRNQHLPFFLNLEMKSWNMDIVVVRWQRSGGKVFQIHGCDIQVLFLLNRDQLKLMGDVYGNTEYLCDHLVNE